MTKCKLCGKPIKTHESQSNIPVYNEKGENTRIDKYHFNCGLKIKSKEL